MKLDSEFKKEIREFSKMDAPYIRKAVKDAGSILSHRYNWDAAFMDYDRVVVCACIAATINGCESEFESEQKEWANLILSAFQEKREILMRYAQFDLHPAIVADNSYFIRRVTVSE